MNPRKFSNGAGFTLIEVLLAIISSSLLVTGIYQIFHAHQNSYLYQDESVKMIQRLRAGITQISKDIRSIGYHPSRGTYRGKKISSPVGLVSNFEYDIFSDTSGSGSLGATSGPINYATDTMRFAFTLDKDGDGIIEDDNMNNKADIGNRGERIAYRLFNHKLQRFNSEVYAENSDLSLAWETLVANVETINLVFLDHEDKKFNGREEDIPDIKSIEVTLLVRSGRKDHKRQGNYIFRNRQGSVICDYCSYSKYRYKIFHNRVKIRNSRSL